jgi:TetR/AcrR family transcriptional repressor of nem operon
MARDGTATKDKILDSAMQLVMDQGYGGMTVDQVIAGAGITKGAFFHHFKTKSDLAQALLDRYVRLDDELLHELIARAEKLSHDPLQQYLIFVGLLEEALRSPGESPPGCLVASYVYQLELFPPDTRAAVINSFNEWRRVLGAKLDAALAKQSAKLPVTSEQLYDNLMAVFEGGVIMSRLYRQSATLPDQVAQHKNYVELLFGLRD